MKGVKRVDHWVGWNPTSHPLSGWLKVNTDGACCTKEGKAATVGLARDGNGQWCGGFLRNIGIGSPFVAKL